MDREYIEIANKFKALSDPNRVHILALIATEEKCACELLEVLNISQSTLSHHMKILTDTGIVNIRRDGKWSHYSISKKGIEEFNEYFINYK